MDQAKDDGYLVWAWVALVEAADEPVEAVETTVGPKSKKIEAVDDGGDGSLAKEEKLRKNADGFQDLGEDPEPLEDCKLVSHDVVSCGDISFYVREQSPKNPS